MNLLNPNTLYKESYYQHRIMVCIIISQLILIAVFRFWPQSVEEKEKDFYVEVNQEIFVEQSIATKQDNAPASPPKPQIPVPVPSEEVIEEDIPILEFSDYLSLEKIGEGEIGQLGDSDEPVASPQRPPTPLKITEPPTPEAAKQAGIKAEIYVTFLVKEDGSVEEIFIQSIRKYDSNGRTYEQLQDIGYGLIEASLNAAEKWRFNPARDNGKVVKAYTTQVFSFGF